MVTTPATLPDNVAALRALVLAARAERDAERAENARLNDERDQLAGQNAAADQCMSSAKTAHSGST